MLLNGSTLLVWFTPNCAALSNGGGRIKGGMLLSTRGASCNTPFFSSLKDAPEESEKIADRPANRREGLETKAHSADVMDGFKVVRGGGARPTLLAMHFVAASTFVEEVSDETVVCICSDVIWIVATSWVPIVVVCLCCSI